MKFEKEKKEFLKKPDKSFKGSIDLPILPLIKIINDKSYYYTKSSCSGRITLIKNLKTKQKRVFKFVSHKKINLMQLKNALNEINSKEDIYFKHEPCILHVACKNLDDAFKLVTTAVESGWKKSGVMHKKNTVELVSTEILATPIMSKGKILIEENYLKKLISEANKKLKKTHEKITKLKIKLMDK